MSKRLRLKLAAVSEQFIKSRIQDIQKDLKEINDSYAFAENNCYRCVFSQLDSDIDAYYNIIEEADGQFKNIGDKVKLLASDIADASFADDNTTGATRKKYEKILNELEHFSRQAYPFKRMITQFAANLLTTAVKDLHNYIKNRADIAMGMVFGYQQEFEDHINKLYKHNSEVANRKASDLFDEMLLETNTEDAYIATYDEAGHGEFEENF